MGLDVTAYSQLQYIETIEDGEEWEDRYYFKRDELGYKTFHARHWESAYADRAAPIVEGGVYRINGKEFDFRAGSYGGYNDWREVLSMMVHGVMPRTIWENTGAYKGTPFFELINFSDCEGILGAAVCAKLAADFAQYQGRADTSHDEWWLRKYGEWRKAFEIAADGGCVEFH